MTKNFNVCHQKKMTIKGFQNPCMKQSKISPSRWVIFVVYNPVYVMTTSSASCLPLNSSLFGFEVIWTDITGCTDRPSYMTDLQVIFTDLDNFPWFGQISVVAMCMIYSFEHYKTSRFLCQYLLIDKESSKEYPEDHLFSLS
jgi:hypothetical protein